MYLKAVRIENFRGIREASLTFDDTTVLIGENDCGRSSILEALTLVLGATARSSSSFIKFHHFHREGERVTGPIRITVQLAEAAPGDWQPPVRIAAAWRPSANPRREAWIEVSASPGEPGTPIALGWSLRTAATGRKSFENDPELLTWARRLSPVASIAGGLTTVPTGRDGRPSQREGPMRKVADHCRNLLTGNSPDLAREIEAGTAAARECIEAHAGAMAGSSLVGAMASEILGHTSTAGSPAGVSMDLTAQKLGVVLLLGAISQAAGTEAGPDSRPVLLLENPESNLHPMTVAAVWQMLQRLRFQKVITTHSGNLLANCPTRVDPAAGPRRRGRAATPGLHPPVFTRGYQAGEATT